MLKHWLHGLRVWCVGFFSNGSNDLVRRCATAWACQTQQCWQPQSLNLPLENSGNNDRTCKHNRHIYIKPLSVCEDTAPALRTKGWSDPAVVR